MKIELERWEVNMVLCGLAELPYEESAATIYRIKEQIEPPEPPVIHCRECAWFAPLENYPEAMTFHQKIRKLFDGVFPSREGKYGICRKVTFCKERPVPTNEDGFCHRAERKESE